jgi:arylformamidase
MKTVYRGLTPDQLQSQYSARAAVPEHPQIFQRWRELSAEFRAASLCELDLPYGDSPRERIDLFMPAAEKPPLLIFIHGGYWQAMDKSDFSFIARELIAHGAAVAIPGYDRCPEVTLERIAEQMRRALLWLSGKAPEFGVDTEQVHLCGHSAGGQLITLLLATDWAKVEPGFDSASLGSGLSISGLFNLEPLIHTMINDALGLDPESARRNSPMWLSPCCRVPLLLAVGGDESKEFHRQSQEFAEAWSGQGVPARYQAFAGLNHFTMVEQLAQPESLLLRQLLDSMGCR